jgi:hypothetical protein
MHELSTWVTLKGRCDKCRAYLEKEVTFKTYLQLAGSTPGTKMTAEAFLQADHPETECRG